jgi:hypothetical protein
MDIAVVVQRQIESTRSGVMFTIDPASGASERLIIEDAFGLGESVVSGSVSPDRYVVGKEKLVMLEREVHRKELTIEPSASGGTSTRELGEAGAEELVLSDEEVRAVAELGVRIEEHYGAPPDTEWGIDASGSIWMLQSRPVTATGGEGGRQLDRMAAEKTTTAAGVAPVTGTKVLVNLSEPSQLARAAALDVDGIGLLRAELMVVEVLAVAEVARQVAQPLADRDAVAAAVEAEDAGAAAGRVQEVEEGADRRRLAGAVGAEGRRPRPARPQASRPRCRARTRRAWSAPRSRSPARPHPRRAAVPSVDRGSQVRSGSVGGDAAAHAAARG